MPSAPTRILIVDDEPHGLRAAASLLRVNGFADVRIFTDPRAMLPTLADNIPSVLLLDLTMPGHDGQAVLADVVEHHPEVPVIILTGCNDVPTAVACMRGGAMDFLVKPIEELLLVAAIRRAVERADLQRENEALRERLVSPGIAQPTAFARFTTRDPRMHGLFQYIEVVAPTAHPVLITGETGTGKELVARTLHELSGRTGAFVAVNVAGLDDAMLTDTLFGHRRGAFTGADVARAGLIERAAHGTLFLDEIGDLGISSQVKLLRLLQEHEYLPLGEDVPRATDARFVVATSRSLTELQDDSRFRRDLFYRLRGHHVHLPPLRERRADIPALAARVLADESGEKPAKRLVPSAVALLMAQPFPGNVRELQAAVRDAATRAPGSDIGVADMAAALGVAADPPTATFVLGDAFPTLREVQDRLVEEALTRSAGNHSEAARLLGITRQGLWKRLRRDAEA